MATLAMSFSFTTNANTITFTGSIVEETCSSSSDNKSCVSMYNVINVKGHEVSTVVELNKLFNKQSNDIAIVDVEKIEGKDNSAIVTANYL